MIKAKEIANPCCKASNFGEIMISAVVREIFKLIVIKIYTLI